MKRYTPFLLLAFLFASCDQPKQKPATFSSAPSVVASSDKVATDEEFEAMTEEQRIEYNNQDAHGEGLSQEIYGSLEYPAELVGVNEMILRKSQFAVSYNTKTLCPNYVCWHLTKDRTRGDLKRPDDFTPDFALSERLQVNTHDYSSSGYDRGHMCPAGDNKNSTQAMLESFMMTNICPQSHDLNAGDWNELEELCRDWAHDYGDLYICCGPIFDSKQPKTIGKRKHGLWISVPDRFFKVILYMGKKPRAIGFIFPNEGTRRDLRTYATSVNKVERVTGMDFFPELPDDLEDKVEQQCNPAAWNL